MNITGLWMSAEAIGKFSGPIIGGIIVEKLSFRYATLFFFAWYWITLSLDCFVAMNVGKKMKYTLQPRKDDGEKTDTERLITKN